MTQLSALKRIVEADVSSALHHQLSAL